MTSDDDENWDKDFDVEQPPKLQLGIGVTLSNPKVGLRLPSPAKDPAPIDVSDDLDDFEKELKKHEDADDIPKLPQTRDEPSVLSSELRKTKHLSAQIEKSDTDWSEDFDQGLEDAPKLKITGIKANPNAKEEDWDEDFDFGDKGPEKLALKSPSTHTSLPPALAKTSPPKIRKSFTLNRVHSSSLLTGVEKLASVLKELLPKFPDLKAKKLRKETSGENVVSLKEHKRKGSKAESSSNSESELIDKSKEAKISIDAAKKVFRTRKSIGSNKIVKESSNFNFKSRFFKKRS